MSDERKRRRALWVYGIGYLLVTLVVNLAFGRPAPRVLGSLTGAVVAVGMLVFLSRNGRLGRLEENRYRVFAAMFGASAVLIVLAAVLAREPLALWALAVPLAALAVTFIAARRASGP